jgi:ferrous iron transport protein A
MQKAAPLTSLAIGEEATIHSVDQTDPQLAAQLEDNGLIEGEKVAVMARGPLGGTPLAIRLGRAVLALRRSEAEAVTVTRS